MMTHWIPGVRPLILAIALVCAPTGALLAQTDSSEAGRPSSSDRPWAMQFAVGSDFNLSTFLGSTVSLKHERSPRHAWRIGLSVNASRDNGQGSGHESTLQENNGSVRDSSSSVFRDDPSDSNVRLSLVTQYLWRIPPRSGMQFFWGAGPRLEYSRNHHEEQIVSTGGGIAWAWTANRTDNMRWSASAGFRGTVGVDWILRKNLSLGAEYGCDLMYAYSESTNDQSNERYNVYPGQSSSQRSDRRSTSISRSLRFDPAGTSLVLSLYF
jgi:hypothetical protein